MPSDVVNLLRVHAGALNGHDPDTLRGHYLPATRVVRDGRPVGQGAEALRELMHEYDREDVVGRVMDVDGQPALVAWSGTEGHGFATSIVRLRATRAGDRVMEVHIDHDARLIQRLVDSAPRA